MLLSPSLHSQCAVVLSHNGIAKVLGLPEYVASTTKSRLTQVYNEWSSIDTDRTKTIRQPCRLNHQRHIPRPVQSPFSSIHISLLVPEMGTISNDEAIMPRDNS
jgi:hypothetical protein